MATTKPWIDPARVTKIRRSLLRWYRVHGRDLPWRAKNGKRPDPYRVLVSEAMLQQTRVATAINYFERFMATWPTAEALAAATEQQVLRMWQGLGYYRRATNLHAAVTRIVSEYEGQVPDNVNQLMCLPGVGRYTAGAIASIAFGKAQPILDGNVARVLARWFAISKPVNEVAGRHRLWELAAKMVPHRTAGEFNQAMMDLGATVCLPGKPRCDRCPLVRLCRAKQIGKTETLPIIIRRATPRRVTHHIVVIMYRGQYLFEQRPDDGLWPNLWQMPTIEQLSTRSGGQSVRNCAQQHIGLPLGEPMRIDAFTHQTTHRTIRFVVWAATLAKSRRSRNVGQWRRLNHVDDLPMSKPQQRVICLLRGRR